MSDGHILPVSPVKKKICLQYTLTNDWTDLQLFPLSSISFSRRAQCHSSQHSANFVQISKGVNWTLLRGLFISQQPRAPEWLQLSEPRRETTRERGRRRKRFGKLKKRGFQKLKEQSVWDTVLTGKMFKCLKCSKGMVDSWVKKKQNKTLNALKRCNVWVWE